MKVHAEGNQSPLHIEVKFCEWKSRYKVYTIKSFDSVSEGKGSFCFNHEIISHLQFY